MKPSDEAQGSMEFDAVYEAYYDRIYKYAFTLLLNREDAEDVASETFFAAYRNFSRYDPRKAMIVTWLSRIVHNCAVDLMRSAAYSRRAELPPDWDREDPGQDFTDQAAAFDLVLWLYAKLSPEEREFLNLRYVMELKDKEIASLLTLPEKTVNKRYQRLLKKCRLLLEDGEG